MTLVDVSPASLKPVLQPAFPNNDMEEALDEYEVWLSQQHVEQSYAPCTHEPEEGVTLFDDITMPF